MAIKLMLLLALTICLVHAEVELITEPKPGQEYVFLQTSGAGSRPIERKEKASENERVFETAHKLPPSLTYAINDEEEEEELKSNKQQKKREALPVPAKAPVPAPAGAIKLDPLKLIEKYKTAIISDLKTSTTTAKPVIKNSRRTTKASRRTKKEALSEDLVTDPTPVLTTASSAAKVVDKYDAPFAAAGNGKQRSRVQIKQGPNGQNYEYEYVYYYYDDVDDKKDDDEKKISAKDGQARNEITQKPTRGRSTTTHAPDVFPNELLPTSRSRSRGNAGKGRQLVDEDVVGDERLPANTRFPPRSRNLNTTPVPEEDEPRTVRGRTRPSRPSNDVLPEADNVSDETQGSRGRTRANVRRPSLDLVDNQSFNTHTNNGNGGEPPSSANGPTFPVDLPAGPVRFLGATPNERNDIPNETAAKSVAVPLYAADEKDTPTDTSSESDIPTTMMSPMDKVALDLYAILQGTQRLTGEDDEENTDATTDNAGMETTTLEMTTDAPTTEATTPSTTTTTTTTTTQAPTTVAAPEPPFGRSKYRGRGATARKTTPNNQASGSTEGPQETKPKSKFARPSFGARPRPGGRTTSAPSEVQEDAVKEESKPVSHARPTIGRSRFGAARTRPTTASPSETSNTDDASASSAAPARPSLRPRPTFNLRGRVRTTAAPGDGEASPAEESDAPSTTARTRGRVVNPSANIRPLRPGPRINNLGGRGRLNGAVSTEAPAEGVPVVEEESHNAEENADKETSEAAPAPDASPINRIRNRQRPNLQVRPKVAASAPVPVRRVNPLLSRRKLGGEPSTSETPQEVPATEAAPAAVENDTETEVPAVSSTTEEPRGLNKLLAGRRRLTHRSPGTIA